VARYKAFARDIAVVATALPSFISRRPTRTSDQANRHFPTRAEKYNAAIVG